MSILLLVNHITYKKSSKFDFNLMYQKHQIATKKIDIYIFCR